MVLAFQPRQVSRFANSDASPAKTAVSLLLGLALSSVGMDTITCSLRLTFSLNELIGGISFLVVVIGLFGIEGFLTTVQHGLKFRDAGSRIDPREVFQTIAEMPRHFAALVRSCIVGVWTG